MRTIRSSAPIRSRTHSTRSESSSDVSLERVISEIKNRGNPQALAGMARFGIQTGTAFGVSVPELRNLARKVGTNHELAEQLWQTKLHDARLLSGMIGDPAMVSEGLMEEWVQDFDSWDIVDGTCGNLFDKTPFAVKKALEWSARDEEYVKRAGFVLMAELAVHDKKAGDRIFLEFLPVIAREASDNRNFVKKAVNWALRQIGKRNLNLNRLAIQTAREIQTLRSKPARWIASDALRELTSPAVQKKFKAGSRSRQ